MTEGLHTKRTRAQFGGPTTSDKYNERVSNNFKDLALLYNRIGVTEERLAEIIRQQHKTIASLDKSVHELEKRVDTATNNGLYVDLNDPKTAEFSGTPFAIPLSDRLLSHHRYNSVSLPTITSASESRIRYQDSEGNLYLPSSFTAIARGVIETADDTNAVINESNIFNAFLNKTGRVWERNVITDSVDQDGAAMRVYIAMPVEVAPSLRANKIMIDPFPARGVDIIEVQYTTKSIVNLNETDEYQPLNHKVLYPDNPNAVGILPPGAWEGDEIKNAGAVSFEFDPKDITALKITLRTRNYYTENGNNIYTYGLADLDVRSEKHLDEGKAIFEVMVPEGEVINSVNDVVPHIYNVNPIEAQEIFDYRIIWEDGGEYTTDVVPLSQRIWIEVTLRKTAGGGTPILSSLDVITDSGDFEGSTGPIEGGTWNTNYTEDSIDGGTWDTDHTDPIDGGTF